MAKASSRNRKGDGKLALVLFCALWFVAAVFISRNGQQANREDMQKAAMARVMD